MGGWVGGRQGGTEGRKLTIKSNLLYYVVQ